MTINREAFYKRACLFLVLVVIFITSFLITPNVALAQEIGGYIDAKVLGQGLGDNSVLASAINRSEALLRSGITGGSPMDGSFIIMFLALGAALGGYALKKSWLLWLAIPLFFLLFLYWAYDETWFPVAAQHSIVFLGVGTTIALAFTAIRMQAKSAKEQHADDNMEDIECNADKSYYAERDRYNNNKNRHKRGR